MTGRIARARASEADAARPATTAPVDPCAGRVEPLAANLGPSAIVLPWPSRDLHPNARGHWSRRAKAAKVARRDAATLALAAGWRGDALPSEGRLHVWIDAYPPDRRHRDTDGVLSSLKAALDGLADALGVNDRRFVPHPFLHDEPRKGGEVRVRITAVPVSEVAR